MNKDFEKAYYERDMIWEESYFQEEDLQRFEITTNKIPADVKKLVDIGAVSSYKDQFYTMYTINRNIFEGRIIDILSEKSSESELQKEREDAYRNKVISSFFEYGKLKSIPSQRKKERIVLEEMARAFEIGKTYTEKEVNIIIADFNDDFCTIRRDMISEGLLEREGSVYTRIKISATL